MTIPHDTGASKLAPTPDILPARELHLHNSQNIASTPNFASPVVQKSHEEAAEDHTAADLDFNPATRSALQFESMHELADVFGLEVSKTSHERDPDGELPRRENTQDPPHELVAKESEQVVPAAETLEDPFKDPVMEPQGMVMDIDFEFVEQSHEQPTQASSDDILTDDGYPEEPVGQEAEIVWIKAEVPLVVKGVEELFTRKIENSAPASGPSSPVVVVSTRNTEAPDLSEEGENTNQQGPNEEIRTTPSEKTQEHITLETSSSELEELVFQPLPESRDRTISPLRRNPVVGFLEERVKPQSPPPVDVEREISPLRRNPPFEAIVSLLNEHQGGVTKLKEGDIDDYEPRGRSMIRTSDIIEARLSGLAQINKTQEEMQLQRERQDEPGDSRPASPTPHQRISASASNQVHTTQTPPKRKPVASKQESTKTSSPLASSSLSRPVSATSAAVAPRRDEASPLRRNPTGISPHARPALSARPAASSNAKEFSQALSKFQTLVTQNPQDAVVASNEVTSRAIAGIYIPGSLREQAVRNLSKSRERGTGERQRK